MSDFVTHEELAQFFEPARRAADRMDDLSDEVVKALAQIRRPSKYDLVAGSGRSGYSETPEPGVFLRAVMDARSRDHEAQGVGKGVLDAIGARYVDEASVRAVSKATLGLTDATGGWIMPNALVDDLTKYATYSNPYRSLVTVRRGVNASTVDIPFRSAAPARAVIATWGSSKENVDLAYNGYTATMYTLARIHDLGRQFVRHSAGAAEADVMEELGNAIGLGEAYYIRQGSGSSEPYGLVTALDNAPATFTSSFTPSATTLAGSVLKAIGTCVGPLAARNRMLGLSAVISGTAYAEMMSQGTDSAGFFFAGVTGDTIPGIPVGTLTTPFGVGVYVDSQLNDDRLIVGEFGALKLYLGEDVRIDSSDVAGDRWDNNLVGFRGEEEIAFDARPAVYSGAFQQVTNLLA